MSSKSPQDASNSNAPQSKSSAATSSERLPFERAKTSKKSPKKPPATPKITPKQDGAKPVTTAQMAIPDVVSKRMASRIAVFCGVPTGLGMATFVASYIVVSQGWFKLPNIAVVLLSMGFFGLGVLGLSYGVISASWDEDIPGSKLGWSEFTTNWGRMISAWRSAKKEN